MANQRNKVETYECQKNETKLIKCLYDQATGDFLGLRNDLAYIALRGDDNECFFSHGYNEKKCRVLYSATKDKIPNAVITTSFKKYFHELLNERRHNEEFSTLFYFLAFINNRKEKTKQHRYNVNLNPIDCSVDYLNSLSPDKEVSFWPDLLNSADVELRSPQVELRYRFFRQMTETSNANIIRNADYLLEMSNKGKGDIVWVGPTTQRFDTTKFKLTVLIFR